MDTQESKVLALKYRPKTFSDLIGQEIMVETIMNSIKMNKIPNAYLLTGIRGVGKTTTARIIAKGINCNNGIENLCQNDFCEHCKAISNSNHIDVLEIDAASKTGVDNVRDLIEFSKYGPNIAKFKVFIIDEVHMLSRQAFNALLKTLEEPPSHLKFIFATTEVRKVPVTVISRCQRFDLIRIKSDLLLKFLKKIVQLEKGNISEKALKLIVKISEGSVRDSLSLLERALISQILDNKELDLNSAQKIFGYFDRSQLIELIKLILEGKETATLEKFRKISDHGVDPKIFLNDFLEIIYFIKNIRIFDKLEIGFSLSESDINEIQRFSDLIDSETLITFWQFTLKTLEELNIVSNQNLSIEMFLIRLIYLKKIPKLEELLNNLENSEDKINSKEIEKLFDKKNDIKNAITGDRRKSSDQIKNIVQEKSENLKKEKVSELINSKKVFYEKLSAYDDLIHLCSKYGEIKLKYELEHNVRLVKFSSGQMEISFNQNISKDFIKNLSTKLVEWTGKRWIITLSQDQSHPTYQEANLRKKKKKLEETIKSNDYKKVLEAFPDAKLISVEKKKND